MIRILALFTLRPVLFFSSFTCGIYSSGSCAKILGSRIRPLQHDVVASAQCIHRIESKGRGKQLPYVLIQNVFDEWWKYQRNRHSFMVATIWAACSIRVLIQAYHKHSLRGSKSNRRPVFGPSPHPGEPQQTVLCEWDLLCKRNFMMCLRTYVHTYSFCAGAKHTTQCVTTKAPRSAWGRD